ncbi:MAG TPA: 4a-hydroxytetrahydrobiopterin dehydratase [Gammaproteobacteria bacterium]|nr:4a-hydroxytetrahydrobiopterin dehydratase [Gammaproteobacteria bacterium]
MKLEQEAIEQLRGRIDRAWEVDEQDSILRRDFRFENYYQTMAFVNAVAWIAHREDHHPDLEVGYNHCRVRYQTHSVGGLSENDFICAARVDALVADHR